MFSQPWGVHFAPKFSQTIPATLRKSTDSASPADQVTLRSKQPVPQFGCRLFGFMSAVPSKEQGEMLHHVLWDNENSLKVQSEIPPDHEFAPHNWEGMMPHSHLPNKHFITCMQNDGYGRILFNEKKGVDGKKHIKLDAYKTIEPFSKDAQALWDVEKLRRNPPRTLMTHLREASSSTEQVAEVRLDNSHPFQLQNFAMMHNGTLAPNMVKWLTQKVEKYHRKFPEDIPLPQGTADSERLFLYLMGRIREKFGTLDSGKIATQNLEDVIRQTLQRLEELDEEPGHAFKVKMTPLFKPNTGLNVKDGSGIRFPFGLTLVLSDGNRMFLSRYNRNLRFATMRGEDGKAEAVLVSTNAIMPSKQSGLPHLQWWKIPESHMVTLERNEAEGTIDCKLQPYTVNRHNPLSAFLLRASLKLRSLSGNGKEFPQFAE